MDRTDGCVAAPAIDDGRSSSIGWRGSNASHSCRQRSWGGAVGEDHEARDEPGAVGQPNDDRPWTSGHATFKFRLTPIPHPEPVTGPLAPGCRSRRRPRPRWRGPEADDGEDGEPLDPIAPMPPKRPQP